MRKKKKNEKIMENLYISKIICPRWLAGHWRCAKQYNKNKYENKMRKEMGER